MSLCTDAGISTATVLLTDGENGIFRSDYGGPRKGLREIRIREAAWALYTLGSSLYLRMGLSNHPYNSIRDEKRGEQILTLWDSERTMDRIIEILDTFRPDVVVSPEAPSSIRKHFEHEATALLVSRAIEKLRARGASYPRAYLQSLDPKYADRYNRNSSFPALRFLSVNDRPFPSIERREMLPSVSRGLNSFPKNPIRYNSGNYR
jgi:LmbE family N-acetylglucosaminyl deacetylase